ncbi:MAG TPA: hypothetical protein VLA49_03230 [Anaerolineales bacterium]|nr:hypothetical protein [Anaerolineales bacterium]
MKKLFSPVVISLLLFLVVPMRLGSARPEDTPIVTPGADPTAYLLGYAKYRNFTTENSWEVFLGLDSVNGASHNLVWESANSFSFVYDEVADKLTTTITNNQGVYSFDYLNYSTQVINIKGDLAYSYLSALNYLQIRITVENRPTTVVNLSSVMLDGNPLGDFTGLPGSASDWMVTGYDLSAGFTMTGTLTINNIVTNSPEQNKVEIYMGRVDHQGPVSSNLIANPDPVGLNAPLTLSASIDDTTTGLSTVASAEYSLDQSGNWEPLSALDGAFDESLEAVFVNLTSSDQSGIHEFCVRGADAAANLGDASCYQYVVDGEGPIPGNIELDPNPVDTSQLVTVTATISDTLTGGSTIVAADYSLDGGASWESMQAQDGFYDSISEAVEAGFPAPDLPGTYEVCVRGEDASGNIGAEMCASLTVNTPQPDSYQLFLPLVSKGSA